MAEFKNRRDFLTHIQKLQQEFETRWKDRNIDALLHALQDMEAEIAEPNFWEKPEYAQQLSQKKATQEKLLKPWKNIQQELSDFPTLVELSYEEYENEHEALTHLEIEWKNVSARYQDLLLSEALMGPDDGCNAILSINSGAGGTESQDWADMLLRMYIRWAEQKSFRYDILDLQSGEEAGIKGATLLISGEQSYGYLKSENGIHRLVRISPFDSNRRRHTSFASVHIMPEIDDKIDIEVDENDLRVDTYRASGAGGQHVNKTDSAIRITHIPTNIVVQCQNERSQHKNRVTATKMLKARLYETEKEKQEENIKNRSGEKKSAAWGNQIRSYVMHPYKMVKDIRTGMESSSVESVLDGNLDDFIQAYLQNLVQN